MVTLFKALKSKKYFSALGESRRKRPAKSAAQSGKSLADHAEVRARRIGIAKGEFVVPEDIDGDGERIRDLFGCR